MPIQSAYSGPMLFLMYAWPCARYRLDKGLITQKDYEDLWRFLDLGSNPSFDLLARCFPNAVREFREFSMPYDCWTTKRVREFWRNHHNHTQSPVRCGRIVAVRNSIVTISVGDRILPVVNEYGLDLNVGDEVFTHNNFVIEKK